MTTRTAEVSGKAKEAGLDSLSSSHVEMDIQPNVGL